MSSTLDNMSADATRSPLLEIRNLRVDFRLKRGTITAVNDLSCAIHQGETVGIVGETGLYF